MQHYQTLPELIPPNEKDRSEFFKKQKSANIIV